MTPQNAQQLRVRENQRRSRERRRQHTQHLEARLRTLEREGVEVTAQVQAAARKVVRENMLFRSFLNHRGIAFSEFEEYVHNFNDDGPVTQGIASNRRCVTSRPSAPVTQQAQGTPIRNTLSLNPASGSSTENLAHILLPRNAESCNESANSQQSKDTNNRDDATSCVLAASIIAGMRGQIDVEAVRAELGCQASQNCMVSNIEVFGAMDS